MSRGGLAPVAGTQLYHEVHEPPDATGGAATTLLLLHGFTLDRRMWGAQVAALGQRHRVVAYDARGFGRSAAPDGAAYRHCEDAAALIAWLGVGPVVAVGHSIGAHQMLELALTRPDLVTGYAALALSGLASVPFSEELAALFAALRAMARAEGVAAAKALWARGGWFATARAQPALAAKLDAMLADYSALHWTGDARALPLEPPASERLGELRMPVLVMSGARDLPYNQRITEVVREGIPHARMVTVADAGHMLPMEAPALVNAELAAFAESIATR